MEADEVGKGCVKRFDAVAGRGQMGLRKIPLGRAGRQLGPGAPARTVAISEHTDVTHARGRNRSPNCRTGSESQQKPASQVGAPVLAAYNTARALFPPNKKPHFMLAKWLKQ